MEATVSKVEGGAEKIKFDKPLTEKKPLVFQSSWADDKGNIGVFPQEGFARSFLKEIERE